MSSSTPLNIMHAGLEVLRSELREFIRSFKEEVGSSSSAKSAVVSRRRNSISGPVNASPTASNQRRKSISCSNTTPFLAPLNTSADNEELLDTEHLGDSNPPPADLLIDLNGMDRALRSTKSSFIRKRDNSIGSKDEPQKQQQQAPPDGLWDIESQVKAVMEEMSSKKRSRGWIHGSGDDIHSSNGSMKEKEFGNPFLSRKVNGESHMSSVLEASNHSHLTLKSKVPQASGGRSPIPFELLPNTESFKAIVINLNGRDNNFARHVLPYHHQHSFLSAAHTNTPNAGNEHLLWDSTWKLQNSMKHDVHGTTSIVSEKVPSMSRGFHFFPRETFFPHVIH